MRELLRVAVIGAGVVGSLIARRLTRYRCEVHLFEKEEDVGWGITKANSAVIHGGYDDPPGSVRARFCAKGNAMYSSLSEELGFELKRIGSFVLAQAPEDFPYLETLKAQALDNGLSGCAILPAQKVRELEPHIADTVLAGFWCPSAGITEPWMVAIGAVENAVKNGARLHLSEAVTGFVTAEGSRGRRVVALKTVRGEYPIDIVINASGLWAEELSTLAGAYCPPLHPKKGEYLLFDKFDPPLVRSILFPIPSSVSKGILVLPTVDGGLLLGPTATDLPKEAREETSTTREGLSEVLYSARKLVPTLDPQWTVKTFAGLRPESPQKDFAIGKTEVEGFIQAAAMRSPGLTAAPAVAEHVVEEVLRRECGYSLEINDRFTPVNPPFINVSNLTLEEWEKKIETDPLYGKIACVCNKVTEGDIRDAVRRGATTVDGVKFRTRASFGRCQGGFCLAKIAEILARESGRSLGEVKMRSGRTELLRGRVRE